MIFICSFSKSTECGHKYSLKASRAESLFCAENISTMQNFDVSIYFLMYFVNHYSIFYKVLNMEKHHRKVEGGGRECRVFDKILVAEKAQILGADAENSCYVQIMSKLRGKSDKISAKNNEN